MKTSDVPDDFMADRRDEPAQGRTVTVAKNLREYMAKMGKKGGKARAANQTAEQRSDEMRRVARIRWNKEKANK